MRKEFWIAQSQHAEVVVSDPRVKKIFDSLRPSAATPLAITKDADEVVPVHLEDTSEVSIEEPNLRTRLRRSTPVFEVIAEANPDPDLDSRIKRNLRLKVNPPQRQKGPSSVDGGARRIDRKERLVRDVRRSVSIVDGISQRYPSAYIKIRRQSL